MSDTPTFRWLYGDIPADECPSCGAPMPQRGEFRTSRCASCLQHTDPYQLTYVRYRRALST